MISGVPCVPGGELVAEAALFGDRAVPFDDLAGLGELTVIIEFKYSLAASLSCLFVTSLLAGESTLVRSWRGSGTVCQRGG
jgi:hypothetical protein